MRAIPASQQLSSACPSVRLQWFCLRGCLSACLLAALFPGQLQLHYSDAVPETLSSLNLPPEQLMAHMESSAHWQQQVPLADVEICARATRLGLLPARPQKLISEWYAFFCFSDACLLLVRCQLFAQLRTVARNCMSGMTALLSLQVRCRVCISGYMPFSASAHVLFVMSGGWVFSAAAITQACTSASCSCTATSGCSRLLTQQQTQQQTCQLLLPSQLMHRGQGVVGRGWSA